MKFSKLVLPGITMIAVTYGLARFSFGLLLPAINESLEMRDSTSGVVSSLFYVAYCVTIVVSTVITTQEGPRRMIILAGLSAFLGLLLMAIAPNVWLLGLGVLLAGGSTGLASPPYGAAVSIWMKTEKQGKANTWINSGTGFGIALSGLGAILLMPHWRLTYGIYAALALFILLWNYKAIPEMNTGFGAKLVLKKGNFSLQGVKRANRLMIASLVLGFSTAAFWTFSRTFIGTAGDYNEWQLSGFWVIIGLFGVLGGFSGSLIEKSGLPLAYKGGSLAIAFASILLALAPENFSIAYISAGLFGCAYIFLTGVLLVWGIRVFIKNASLGIGVPFLLLAVGQVIGSSFAGVFIESWGYSFTFMLYGLGGIAAAFIGLEKG
ncbi:MFS transporter [Oceanobacillus jeddahense]|uniref:MFS transporter n=1 Tax=Oceanobacillus jeddahense TaxID=1462527 RepID=UPI0005962E06|nr:MFS transporter [Oceanobacillus jeddahense]